MKKGFTLVELIIVISIISLLSVVGVGIYNSVQVDTRNARRKSDLKEVQKALESYKLRNGAYPSTVGRVGCRATNYTTEDGTWCGICARVNDHGVFSDIDSHPNNPTRDDTGYIPNLAPAYIPRLPRDPRESKENTSSADPGCYNPSQDNTCYYYNSNGTDYKLVAHCTPEGTLKTDDPFVDPLRTSYSWAVYSSDETSTW